MLGLDASSPIACDTLYLYMAYYHYTSRAHAQDIQCTLTIMVGRVSGKLWLTTDVYSDGWEAAEKLGIVGKAVEGYCSVSNPPPLTPASIVQPVRDNVTGSLLRVGGGVEYTSTAPVTFTNPPQWTALAFP
jgi:hypothetical protein